MEEREIYMAISLPLHGPEAMTGGIATLWAVISISSWWIHPGGSHRVHALEENLRAVSRPHLSPYYAYLTKASAHQPNWGIYNKLFNEGTQYSVTQ